MAASDDGKFTRVSCARVEEEEYRLLQQRIGTSRNVIVTPAPYKGDNRVTLDAIARLAANENYA